MLAKSLSWYSQNLPCSLAAIAASAAPLACAWKDSGWWRKTIRTSFGYFCLISLSTGTALEQYGHWKSDHSTMVTFASFLPQDGESAGASILRTTCAGAAGWPGAAGAA